MTLALILSLVVCVLAVFNALETFLGYRTIPLLDPILPALPNPAPKVSIIVSALNEADTIEPALLSLLALEYPNLEIIAINDRSTDATPAILDRIGRAWPALRVLHIDTLPAGWLGKNHALHQGAKLASGDYLLFTDADVMFKPDTIDRAVTYCEQQQVDHLALLFKVLANSALLRMMMVSFMVGFLAFFKPWKVNSATSSQFCGIGGFNLLRRKAYIEAGGHAALPMAVLDDMQLGKLMKTKGYRQHVLGGTEFVAVEWYPSVWQMIKGTQKNSFAGLDYKLSYLILITVVILLLRVWPWFGLFVTEGAAWWLNVVTILSSMALYANVLHRANYGYRCLLFYPVVILMELGMFWWSALLVLKRGGIDWRGTFYSLEELKRHL